MTAKLASEPLAVSPLESIEALGDSIARLVIEMHDIDSTGKILLRLNTSHYSPSNHRLLNRFPR